MSTKIALLPSEQIVMSSDKDIRVGKGKRGKKREKGSDPSVTPRSGG
jgi:hypothetical protein